MASASSSTAASRTPNSRAEAVAVDQPACEMVRRKSWEAILSLLMLFPVSVQDAEGGFSESNSTEEV